jgi:hypothetical protein
VCLLTTPSVPCWSPRNSNSPHRHAFWATNNRGWREYLCCFCSFADGKVKPKGVEQRSFFFSWCTYGTRQIRTQTTTNPNHVGKQNPIMCDLCNAPGWESWFFTTKYCPFWLKKLLNLPVICTWWSSLFLDLSAGENWQVIDDGFCLNGRSFGFLLIFWFFFEIFCLESQSILFTRLALCFAWFCPTELSFPPPKLGPGWERLR